MSEQSKECPICGGEGYCEYDIGGGKTERGYCECPAGDERMEHDQGLEDWWTDLKIDEALLEREKRQ